MADSKNACKLINGMHKFNNSKLIGEKPRIRKCLKCNLKFTSHSKINRLCQTCRKGD